MDVRLVENRYGKSEVRLVVVDRGEDRHELRDVTVDLRLTGDFEAAHRAGDNARVYPTDSMKNSVYLLARRHGAREIEELGLLLARHLLGRATRPDGVEVRLVERLWSRIERGGEAHPHAFVEAGAARRTARIEADASGERIESGLEGLRVLKTTGSGFAGFPRDETTTLPETDDRIFATAIEARWSVAGDGHDWASIWSGVRSALLDSFAGHDESRSVQHTLWQMARAVLDRFPAIDRIALRLPNQHHLRVDLAPLGLDNPNLVFVAPSEPYGVIEATLARS
jgi:urate oxidase